MSRASLVRRAAIAVATVGAIGALSATVLPDEDRLTPRGQQQELQRQYRGDPERKRELERHAKEAGRVGEAVTADRRRAAEVRQAEREAARRAARGLLRKP